MSESRRKTAIPRVGRGCAALAAILLAAPGSPAWAGVRLPHIFGDNMVLQRQKPVCVWGWADKGEQVTVAFAGQTKTAAAGDDGKWELVLAAMEASAEPREFSAKGKDGAVACRNVLVGDVWVLGGQSNMEAALVHIQNGDLEALSADLPGVRLMTIPLCASPTPLEDFPRLDEYNAWSKVTEHKGDWRVCSPETVKLFSAVGYVFGRRIHLATKVPIGRGGRRVMGERPGEGRTGNIRKNFLCKSFIYRHLACHPPPFAFPESCGILHGTVDLSLWAGRG
jgi:hypothetical protein